MIRQRWQQLFFAVRSYGRGVMKPSEYPVGPGVCSVEFSLWNLHLSSVGNHVQREDVESSHMNNQQPNDLMSRSVQRRLLCDGSFDKDVQKAGFGVIMVNPEGRVVDGVAGHFFCGTSMVAEARAVLGACILASREEGRADVWSDCKEVVDACGQEIQDCPLECSAVVASIEEILIAFSLIHVLHCNRQCVSAANRMAKQARDRTLREDWLGELICSANPIAM
ncbi:hypothetical protein LINGRAHAP2_LOCUS1651 [Linum grandiflorum]